MDTFGSKLFEEADDVGDATSPLGSEWSGTADWDDPDMGASVKEDDSGNESESSTPVLQPRSEVQLHSLKAEPSQPIPLRTVTSGQSREQWRELHNRVKNFTLFGGREVAAPMDVVQAPKAGQGEAALSRASSSHPMSALYEEGDEQEEAVAELERTQMTSQAQEVSAKLTDILVQAEAASRATMKRMFDDLMVRMWLHFRSINVKIKLGLQALALIGMFQPIAALHLEEERGRLHVHNVESSGYFTIRWYGFADREHLARQEVGRQQLAAFQAIGDECEVRLDVLRTGVSAAFLRWQRRTTAAWRVQFWFRRCRLRRQLQATAETDRVTRQLLLAKMALAMEQQGVVNMDYKTYEEGVLQPRVERRRSRAGSFQQAAVVVDPEVLEKVRALRRKQVRQLEKDVAGLEGEVGTLKASMRKLQEKQYNLHKKATGLAHQTACLRDQLVADHGSLRQAEARLKGMADLGKEIARLRSENATLEILIRGAERECEVERQRVGDVEQKLRHRREVKQSRLEATQRSALKRKARLEHACRLLREDLALAEDGAQQRRAAQEAAAAKLQREEDAALTELRSCEAERDALLATLQKQQRALKRREAMDFFPSADSLQGLPYAELWQVARDVHLLHDAVCAAIGAQTTCLRCKVHHASTLLLPCEHPQLCAPCAGSPLPARCGVCGAAVEGYRPLPVAA
eukprot:EG_transcript_3993